MESLRQKAKQSMALWMIGMYGRKTEKIRDTLVKISEALRCIMYYYQLIATSGRRLICDEMRRSSGFLPCHYSYTNIQVPSHLKCDARSSFKAEGIVMNAFQIRLVQSACT